MLFPCGERSVGYCRDRRPPHCGGAGRLGIFTVTPSGRLTKAAASGRRRAGMAACRHAKYIAIVSLWVLTHFVGGGIAFGTAWSLRHGATTEERSCRCGELSVRSRRTSSSSAGTG
ncbi:hypothetical protein C8039_13640 [Halogeometricum sp. wsp3]|nr:hypothetical protein C8039_13640 [Halogeometricum sp. wsp3]